MVEIVEILSRCDEQMGVLKPFICRGDDDKLYYVKGSNCTPREQVAEWVAANLANRFGLPTPCCDIAYVDPDLVELAPSDWQRDLRQEHCFASQSVEPCQTLTLPMARRVDKALQYDVLLFDYWICNSDRNLSEKGGNVNLLTDPEGKTLHVIDFNLAFEQSFSVADLYNHVFWPSHKGLLPDMVDRLGYEERFTSTLSHLNELVATLPVEWTESASVSLDYIHHLRETLERHTDKKFWDELL